MAVGIVKWFSSQDGYGFISQENGPDVFVHHRCNLRPGDRSLEDNQKVECDITEGPKGPQAANVPPWARFPLASGLSLWRRRLPA